MDEMKLNLGSKFMRKMLSKILTKMFYKKFGYRIDIKLDELNVHVVDGDTKIKLNAEVQMNSIEFKKVMEAINDEL